MSLPARRGNWWCAALAALAVLAVLEGCSPALDWRDVRPAGTSLAMQFPCRPVGQQRAVPLAGPAVDLSLLACTAGGRTWALAHADLVDPARVGPALVELRASTLAKLKVADGASPLQSMPVPGATPNDHGGRLRLVAPPAAASTGSPVEMELALFAQGTRVYQASVLGNKVPADAADNFFASIRFGR